LHDIHSVPRPHGAEASHARIDRELPADAAGVRWIDRALIAYGRGPEHPAKIRILQWMIRLLVRGRLRVHHASGAIIAIDPADYIGWTIFRTGHYEPASLALVLRIMAQEPGLFVDVGAAFGWYTCAVAPGADCTVVSIEPDCENCARLRGNIELSGLRNVSVFNGAVGAGFDAVETEHRARGNSGTVAIRSGDETPGSPGTWTTTVPLDALLNRLVRHAIRPVLIKIDVEGFEAEVLAGLDFAGPYRPKHILMELDPQLSARSWKSRESMRAFFAAKGYDVLDVHGQPLGESPDVPEDNVWLRDRRAGSATG
jgi:FkbM family methyltransferase